MTDITLNDQQQNAIDAMLDFIYNDEAETFTLKGFAGTGKTTTIQFLIDKIAEDYQPGEIFFTAPTHKAVKVLKKLSQSESMVSVIFSTIHSLLGLKVHNKADKQCLKSVGYRKDDPLRDAKIIVIDECSMISQELFGYINESLKKYDIKYIFMGDPAQLPPVGEKESPTFERVDWQLALTKIMRQRGENPVLGVCTDVREAWARGDTKLPKIITGMAKDGSVGVSFMAGSLFTDWMPTAFSHDLFDSNSDRFRVIAWRNETVSRINAMIHNFRYPDCKTWLAVGEPVVFVKPLLNQSLQFTDNNKKNDEIFVQTDFEGEVLSCEKGTRLNFPDLPCWLVTVKIETGEEFVFYALDNEGLQVRDSAMKNISSKIRAMEKEGKKESYTWWPFYELRDSFAEIRPAYCLTAHKSQGSTFENVFVDVLDIWTNLNKSEAMQCLYVACSRASHHLIVNGSGT